jgi:hypothetical protein
MSVLRRRVTANVTGRAHTPDWRSYNNTHSEPAYFYTCTSTFEEDSLTAGLRLGVVQ